MIYLQLFWEFFKAGLFAIGGGLATLPFLQEISAKMGWFTTTQLADMIAVSECTPGPIGVNMATYAGFTTAGVPGAIVATLGLIFPSVVIIIIVARILRKFKDSELVQSIFFGLRPASTGLIAAACIGVAKASLVKLDGAANLSAVFAGIQWKAVALAVVLWLLMNLGKYGKLKENKALQKLSKLHPVVFLAAAALVGIVFKFG